MAELLGKEHVLTSDELWVCDWCYPCDNPCPFKTWKGSPFRKGRSQNGGKGSFTAWGSIILFESIEEAFILKYFC